VTLCFINLLLIVAVVATALGSIALQGRPPCTESPAIAPNLTLLTAFGAATNVVYSYAGQWMYFEVMDTMEKPSHFPRAFAVTGPIMVCIYLVVALVSHYFGVDRGNILEAVPHGPAVRVVATMLFAHVLIVYLVKSIVLQRFCHSVLSPRDADRRSLAAYLKHGSLGLAMLVFGYLVANAVPFFSQLLGLIGGFLGGPINFLFPVYLYLAALGRHRQAQQEANPTCDPDTLEREGDLASPGDDRAWQTSSVRAALQGLSSLKLPELLMICLVFVIIGMTMVLGVAEEVKEIIALNGEVGEPFACHALAPVHASSFTNATGSPLCP